MAIDNKFLCGVVLFNPTKNDIEQLKIYLELFDEVFLYDNSSENLDLKELMVFSNLIYESHPENNGISGALNRFLDYAKSLNYTWIVTMDQDSIFSDIDINRMKEYINNVEDDSVAIYAANFNKMYWKDDVPIFTDPVYTTESNTEVCWHISSGNFINVNIASKFFPLDDYFIAFVDYDLDFTLRKEGYKIMVIGNAVISQQIGQKFKYSRLSKIGLTNMSPERYYYLVRNNFYFSRKFKAYPKAVRFARSRRIRYLGKLILSEKNKILKIKMMIRGYRDYKSNILGKYRG